RIVESFAPMPDMDFTPSARAELQNDATPQTVDYPLGAARAQIHENYIVEQSTDGLVLIDQHAAHERLVYEKFKGQMAEGGVESQGLLVPDIIDMNDVRVHALMEKADMFKRLGLEIEPFGSGSIAVRSVPL